MLCYVMYVCIHMCTAVAIIERLAAGFLQTCCQGYYPSSAGRTLRRGGCCLDGPPLVQKGLRGFGRSSNAGRAGLHLLWQVGNRGTSPGHCYWGWPKAIAAPKWFQTLWTLTNGSWGMFRLPFDEPYHMWMATEWTCKTIAYIWKTSQDDAVRCLVLIRSFL